MASFGIRDVSKIISEFNDDLSQLNFIMEFCAETLKDTIAINRLQRRHRIPYNHLSTPLEKCRHLRNHCLYTY